MPDQLPPSPAPSWSTAFSLTYRLLLAPIGYTLRLLFLILLWPIAYVLRIFVVWPAVRVGRLAKVVVWVPVAVVLRFEVSKGDIDSVWIGFWTVGWKVGF
jgi:integral membrane sensor domain MASE1